MRGTKGQRVTEGTTTEAFPVQPIVVPKMLKSQTEREKLKNARMIGRERNATGVTAKVPSTDTKRETLTQLPPSTTTDASSRVDIAKKVDMRRNPIDLRVRLQVVAQNDDGEVPKNTDCWQTETLKGGFQVKVSETVWPQNIAEGKSEVLVTRDINISKMKTKVQDTDVILKIILMTVCQVLVEANVAAHLILLSGKDLEVETLLTRTSLNLAW